MQPRMASVTSKMLKNMLKRYKYVDLAQQDISAVLAQYKDLKPVMDTYVFNDGSSRNLMSLCGTLPVNYRGALYNIPVCIWLLDTYPYNPPICFVKPTSAMMIKTGKHIDANGKIYLPYMHEWKHPESDLYGLVQVMALAFGEEPPVFSRPTNQSLLLTVEPYSGQGVAPKPQISLAGTAIDAAGSVDTVATAVRRNSDQTGPVTDESTTSFSLSTPETSPATGSAPEMPLSYLSTPLLSAPPIAASNEYVLQRQKTELEIDVLQRQKKVLEIQEQYYSIKLKRLNGDDAHL
ncbi:hypothetical protein GJAV_G00232120 [Gymnothorax javanicus]|nr:hypothetical protein GJAV_G00232120 [Gymnothorax javanicus]